LCLIWACPIFFDSNVNHVPSLFSRGAIICLFPYIRRHPLPLRLQHLLLHRAPLSPRLPLPLPHPPRRPRPSRSNRVCCRAASTLICGRTRSSPFARRARVAS
jgi:hypothetical protein